MPFNIAPRPLCLKVATFAFTTSHGARFHTKIAVVEALVGADVGEKRKFERGKICCHIVIESTEYRIF